MKQRPAPNKRDPWSVPEPLRGPEPNRPIGAALVVDPAGQGTSKQVADGVQKAAQAVDAGYAVQEVEPPSIELAAKTCLDMLNTPDIRALFEMTSAMLPADKALSVELERLDIRQSRWATFIDRRVKRDQSLERGVLERDEPESMTCDSTRVDVCVEASAGSILR